MIASSMSYKKAIRGSRVMSVHDEYVFADGSRPEIHTVDFMRYSIEEAVSDSTSFSIGSAIIKKYSATLNNTEEKFSAYDFEGLDIISKVGVQLEDRSVEIIPKGRYRCVGASINENTIDLEAYDSMIFFDRPYTESTLAYPASIRQIVNDACLHCEMTYNARTLPYGDYVVEKRPDDESITFRDVIGYCAQIMCCYAKIDHLDALAFGWYDFATLEKLQGGYSGGNFKDYRSGSILDGGNFIDYSRGDRADGSTFAELNTYHHLYSLGSQKINTDEIVITGIQVTASDENEDEENESTEENFLYGRYGYVLAIEENPLIQRGRTKQVAEYIGKKMVGKRFRPLSVTCQSDPCIEAGDCTCVTDRKQRTFFTVICNTVFTLGGLQSVECVAETPTEKNYAKYSAVTKLLQKTGKNTQKKISTYDIAVRHLTDLITQSFGVFKSEEKLEDGSIVYYLHNKPERQTSSTIWKMTADAFAVSTDGGKTWNAGMDADGNAVVNVLNAIGINADWINAGSLLLGGTQHNKDGTVTVYDKNGKVLFKVSKDGIVIDTKNLKISQNGDVEVYGKLKGQDKLYIRNPTQGVDKPVIEYVWSTENAAYRFLGPEGEVIMETSQQETPLQFPLETLLKKARIAALSHMDYSFNTHGQYIIDAETGKNMTTQVSGTARISGVFIQITGKVTVRDISAGENIEIDLTEEGDDLQPLTGGFPKHESVEAVGTLGTRVLLIKLSTKGVLSVKNCGTDYKNSEGGSVSFRFDYTLV